MNIKMIFAVTYWLEVRIRKSEYGKIKFKHFFISMFVFMLLFTRLFSQSLLFDNVERISLETDRELYLSGEPVWYNASYAIASDSVFIISKVLYVELFNNEGQQVASQKIAINAKKVISGRVIIPEHLPTGYYIIRAYTRFQENFPAWQFSSKVISVVNPFHPLPAITIPTNRVDIVFMNNGHLGYRITETLAQKVKDVGLLVNGEPVETDGIYYKNGLGSFSYFANSTDSISLFITMLSGDSLITNKQAICGSTNQLLITQSTNNLNFRLISNQHKNQNLHLSIININNRETLRKQFIHDADSFEISIPNHKLGRGLLLASIYDENKIRIAQSIYYVFDNIKTKQTVVDTNIVSNLDTIIVNLSEINNNDFPISVSMVSVGTKIENTKILPNYIIDNPIYLSSFIKNNPLNSSLVNQINIAISIKQKILFDIIKVSSNNSDLVLPELSGLTLNGKILNPKTKEPIQNELVFMSIIGSSQQFHVSKSSSDGRFVFPVNFCNNKQDIFLGTNNADKSNIEFIVDDGYSSIPPIWISSNFIPDTSLTKLITQMFVDYQINKVFRIGNSITEKEIIINRPIFGNNLKQIKLSDFIQLSSTPEVFNELVPNVRVRKKNGHYELIVFNDKLNIKYNNPLILVDNLPFNNIDKIMDVQPTEIEQISVSNYQYVYGKNIFNGIIAITTKSGNFAGLPISEGGVFVEYNTLVPEITFTPSNIINKTAQKPYFATTAYWKVINNYDNLTKLKITVPNDETNYELSITSLKTNKHSTLNKQIIIKKK